jgi:hypothetical protein
VVPFTQDADWYRCTDASMQDGAALRRLLAFLRPGASTLLYEHLASVVCNVSRLRAGRAMLVQPETAGLQLVADLLSSESEVKRSGGAAACKHICVHARAEGALETVLEGTGSLRKLLVSPPWVLSYVTIMQTALPSASSATRRDVCARPVVLVITGTTKAAAGAHTQSIWMPCGLTLTSSLTGSGSATSKHAHSVRDDPAATCRLSSMDWNRKRQ